MCGMHGRAFKQVLRCARDDRSKHRDLRRSYKNIGQRFGDSHIEIVARKTVSPLGSVTTTSTGSA
jgi:hypothetical protein